MNSLATRDNININNCKTLRTDQVAEILGIGRSSAYSLVREAATSGNPFKVIRLGNSLLVSRKSFNEYLEENGL